MRRTVLFIFLLTGLGTLAGCGQTGALYLPQDEPQQDAPQSAEEKEGDTEPPEKPAAN